MKRKVNKLMFLLLSILLTAFLMATVLAACDGGGSNTQKHEHSYTLVEAKAPTCTENGNIQYYTCSCGKYFDKEKNEIDLSKTVVASPGHDKVATSWESDGTSHWHKCNNCNEKLDFSSHTPADKWIEDSAATCKSKAHHHKECPVCGYETEEEDYGTFGQHKWNAQNKCDVCGIAKPYIEEEGKIYFGEYPQSKETDNGVIHELNGMAGANPVKGNAGKWKDYKYYIKGNVDEFMWYIDLEYQGVRYRGVYFTSYRSYKTTRENNQTQMHQKDNGYLINEQYWFKWEPIEWRVLEKTDGEAFLMSNVILDAQHFYNNQNDRDMSGTTVYPNNYKESDIRAWLTGTFYEWAFDELDQSLIIETTVDNSAKISSTDATYVCENTQDKVFLLSYQDIINSAYGFVTDINEDDKAKQLKPTDYCQSQGIMKTFRWSCWWLRSPGPKAGGGNDAIAISVRGSMNPTTTVDSVHEGGVVPAIKITLYK